MSKSRYLRGARILPPRLDGRESVAQILDTVFTAYNAARLREAARLYTRKMLAEEVTVGLSITGALTPGGYGVSCLIPLIEAGFVDWIVSTGANLYHDLHYGLDMKLYRGSPFLDDVELRRRQIIRIYDILFDYDVLLDTDAFVRRVIHGPEFQCTMGTDEFHYLLGKYVSARGRKLGLRDRSLIATAYEYGVPCFTSSPGDSSIGMNVAGVELRGSKLRMNPSIDVNETTGIVLAAKRAGGKSGVVLWGGGSPKNFMLQTEPQIQEVMGIQEKGHDYFLQCTDARPDTGGLSGATPAEAVSWGKVDPQGLRDTVVCYTDSTIALPILTAYTLNQCPPRPLKRLYDRRPELMTALQSQYLQAQLARRQAQTGESSLGVALKDVVNTAVATYPCGTPIRR